MGYGYGISDARGYVNARDIREARAKWEAKAKPLKVDVVRSPAGEILGAVIQGAFFAREDYTLETAFAKLDENPFEEER